MSEEDISRKETKPEENSELLDREIKIEAPKKKANSAKGEMSDHIAESRRSARGGTVERSDTSKEYSSDNTHSNDTKVPNLQSGNRDSNADSSRIDSEKKPAISTENLPPRVEVTEDENIVRPIRIRLYRNNETRVESYEFMPKDEIRLDVLGTGISKATELIMRDIEGKIRFRARSGGLDHVFKTKIQFTRSYGTWTLELNYPNNLEEMENMTLEFTIAKELPPVFVPEHLRVKEIDGEELPLEESTDIEEQEIIIGDTEDSSSLEEQLDVMAEVPPSVWEEIPVTEISSIEPVYRTKLFHKGVRTLREFLDTEQAEISHITSASISKVAEWFETIKAVIQDTSSPLIKMYDQIQKEEEEYSESISVALGKELASLPVSVVKFVGAKSEEKLNSIGVYTVGDLITFDISKIDTSVIQKSLFNRWVTQAHKQLEVPYFDKKARLAELRKMYFI